MNFNFNFNSNFSMSNGKMVIKNGSQTIKMGPNGMEISNGSSNNIVMSSNGIQVSNRGSNVYSVDISSNNGISVNGRPIQSNYYTTSNTSTTQNYYDEDDEEEESMESPEEDEDANIFNMGTNYYNNNNNNNFYFGNNEEGYDENGEEEMESEEVNNGLDLEQINALPVMTYSSKMEMQAKMLNKKSSGPTSNNFCSICIVDYKNGDRLRCMPCFHRFHQKCIDEWLIIKNECPLCKSSIE